MLKVTVNEMELAYERRGRGKPLILLHGHPLDHTIWEPLVPLLEGDFDLLLPDLRGFGQSAAPRTSYLLTDMAADILALMDALQLDRAVLAGHSMGGYIALAFARAWPERLAGLGLVASHVFADPPERRAVRYRDAAEIETRGPGLLAETFPPKLTPDPRLQARLGEIIARQDAWGVAQSLRAMAERPDASTWLTDFDFPILMVHGAADSLLLLERARQAKALAPKIHLVEIADVAHMPMMEAPEATAEALRFFKK
ncbi:MAG: alpha/beta hydrolase [Anaerolineales bacterium]